MAIREPDKLAVVKDTTFPTPAFLSAKVATGDANAIFVESFVSPAGTLTSVRALGVVIVALVVRLYVRDDGVTNDPPIVSGR